MTRCQRAVLEWLLAYPTVEIAWMPLERARWTSWWASEEARQHMVGVLTDLGGTPDVKPRGTPQGGTPRLTTQTFEALLRRGLVTQTRSRRASGVMAGARYWQISRAGTLAVRT